MKEFSNEELEIMRELTGPNANQYTAIALIGEILKLSKEKLKYNSKQSFNYLSDIRKIAKKMGFLNEDETWNDVTFLHNRIKYLKNLK